MAEIDHSTSSSDVAEVVAPTMSDPQPSSPRAAAVVPLTVTSTAPAGGTSLPAVPHAPLALSGPAGTIASALMPAVRTCDLHDIAEADRPLAQQISESALLGDPDRSTISNIEVQRAWALADVLHLDKDALTRLSEAVGVAPPGSARYQQAAERLFGPSRPERQTRIISTIGPASSDVPTLTKMIQAGTDVARLNFSHIESYEQAKVLVDNLRAAMQAAGRDIAILADLPGPKIRVGALKDPVELPTGSAVMLTGGEDSNSGRLAVNPPQILHDLRVGDRVFIDDGRVALRVTSKSDDGVQTEVLIGGTVRSHKGLNLPDTRLSERIPTPRDLEKMQIARSLGIHLLAASYVEDASDVERVRQAFGAPVQIIAKMERPQALQNLDEIYRATDGVMVARGDLAIEVGDEQVPIAQQRLNHQGVTQCVPTGTATQMLESMTSNSRATRAEVGDVARAVFEGSAFVMTSEETAMGVDPAHVVETMARIVTAAEAALRSGNARPS